MAENGASYIPVVAVGEALFGGGDKEQKPREQLRPDLPRGYAPAGHRLAWGGGATPDPGSGAAAPDWFTPGDIVRATGQKAREYVLDPLADVAREIPGILRRALPFFQFYMILRQMMGAAGVGAGPASAPARTVSLPLPPVPQTPHPTQGGSTVAWIDDLGTALTSLAGAAMPYVSAFTGRNVQAYAQPAVPAGWTPVATNGGNGGSFFDIPGFDLQSPIVSESTTAARDAMAMVMSPFGINPAARCNPTPPKLFVMPNPTTGKATFFSPVKITGVRPYNTGIRRHRRCCSKR